MGASRWLHRLSLWLPVFAFLGLSFFLSSIPGEDLDYSFPDWLAHGLQFLMIGLLVIRALNAGMTRRPGLRLLGVAVLLCLLWAVTDEYHQSFVTGRSASVLDLVSDLVGSVAACLVFSGLRPFARSWI